MVHGTREQTCLQLAFVFLVSEYNVAGRSPQGRKQGRSTFRGDFDKRNPHYQHGGYELQPSHHRKDGGNVDRRLALKYQLRQ